MMETVHRVSVAQALSWNVSPGEAPPPGKEDCPEVSKEPKSTIWMNSNADRAVVLAKMVA